MRLTMALAGTLIVFAGCREELGPVRFATAPVAGQVRAGGEPLGGGWIEFAPVDGTVGNLRSAPIGTDGRFRATGVAVGRNRILLVQIPARMHGGSRVSVPLETPIYREIPAQPTTDLVIDLVTEAIRYRNDTTRALPETSR